MGDLERTEEHRRFLDFLRETIVASETDLLVIAGDIFDSATPPQSAVRLYFDFLAALNASGLPRRCAVVVTSGNHDSPAHLESPRALLNAFGVHVSATLPMRAEPGAGIAAGLVLIPLPAHPFQLIVAAVPYLRERDLRTGRLGQSASEIQRDLQEGVARRYAEIATAAEPWVARGVPVLATGHLTALGATASDSEREIHVGGLGAVGADAFPSTFNYVALGHLHRPQAVGGQDHIRDSGSPIALSFGEATDRKEIRLLDFRDGRLAGNAPVPVPQARALVQLRVQHSDLTAALSAFSPSESELEPWVEVIVEGASGAEDLYKSVQDAVAGKPFRVLKVVDARSGAAGGLTLDTDATEIDAGDLLANPKAVFRRRLELEPLGEEEVERLATAFDELCALLDDRRRMRETVEEESR